jgi:hypothetical protein
VHAELRERALERAATPDTPDVASESAAGSGHLR